MQNCFTRSNRAGFITWRDEKRLSQSIWSYYIERYIESVTGHTIWFISVLWNRQFIGAWPILCRFCMFTTCRRTSDDGYSTGMSPCVKSTIYRCLADTVLILYVCNMSTDFWWWIQKSLEVKLIFPGFYHKEVNLENISTDRYQWKLN